MMTNTEVFVETFKRCRNRFILAFADSLFHLELALEHQVEAEPIPEGSFTAPPLTEAEFTLLDKMLIDIFDIIWHFY